MDDLGTAYHYCSIDKFMKIIRSGELWMTNILTTNDRQELIFIRDKCLSIFDQYLQQDNEPSIRLWYEAYQYPEKIPNILQCPRISEGTISEKSQEFQLEAQKYSPLDFDAFREMVVKGLSNYKKDIGNKINNRLHVIYLACFSLESDKLSMWRAYAEDGKGVALGFNRNVLIKTGNKRIYGREVQYFKNKENRELTEIIKDIIVNDFIEKNKEAVEESFCKLADMSQYYKNPAFEEEKEWRLLFDPKKECADYPCSDTTKCFLSKDYNYNGYDLVEYYKYPFKQLSIESENIINEIILGPKCNIYPDDMMNFLKLNGYIFDETKIKKSSASYL